MRRSIFDAVAPMIAMRIAFSGVLLAGLAAAPLFAQQVGREQDIGDLRLGQRVLVDDGTCPAGQVKEVSGTRMTATGIARMRKCVPRQGPPKRQ